MSNLPKYWTNFKELSLKKSLKTLTEKEIEEKTEALVKEFKSKNYIKMLPSEALNIDDGVICKFYLTLGQEKFSSDGVSSPVENYEDSSWMYHSDFCFINVRALGKEQDITGNFLDAMKLIPVIRANSIHLSPFFDCALTNLYAVDSLRIITKDVLSAELLEGGIEPDEQLLLLMDAIHILNKTAGFDLEPHTSQFSRIVLEHPEHFRWIRLDKKKTGLYKETTHTEMLSEEGQEKIQKEVNKIIKKILKEHKLKTVEDLSCGVEILRKAHSEITTKLIDSGLWTLPSQTWGGVGLPEFDFYNTVDNHPDFIYLDAKGEDQHEHSFGMLTPYKFYTNLPFNTVPKEDNLPSVKEDTVEFFKGVFPDIQKRYKFDYVRLDYVDHVFDSTVNESWDIPVSDRMTPQILSDVLGASRVNKKFTGAMAERMGCDVKDYKKLGFDLILGNTMLTTMHSGYVRYLFDLEEEIKASIAEGGVPSSVLFAVDTHDSGHPLFWTVPMSEVVGPEGMHLRHFLSRFTWTGKGRRPKYEVIGNQDLSYGLYEANNKLKSMVWKSDKDYNDLYHGTEDVYERFRDLIFRSHIGPTYVASDCAFWFLDREDGYRERLLCVAALEKEFEKVRYVIQEKPVYPPVKELVINFMENYHMDNPEISEVDLRTGEFKQPNQISHYQVAIKELPPLGVKLFFIRERG